MSKKLIISAIVVLILGIGYFALRRPTTAPDALTSQSTSSAMSESIEFAQAVQSGRPTACTLAKGDDRMEYQLQDQKMRAKIVSNQTINHMINDKMYIYIWAEGQSQGTKMAVPSEEEMQKMTDNSQNPAPAFGTSSDYESMQNQGYTINCQATQLSATTFTPPSDINFIDPTEMMKDITMPDANGNIDYQQLQQQYQNRE